jgi:GT2 family glycosyltransferase
MRIAQTLKELSRSDSRQSRRLRRIATDGKPLVSVVVGTFNRIELLSSTIETIRSDLEGVAHELIVVDGGSDDGTAQWLQAQRDTISIVQHNRGEWRGERLERRSWGYFMNLGFKIASGKYICMVSDDCLVVPGAIKNGVEVFESQLEDGKLVGAVAFYWRNWPQDQSYRVGITFGNRLFVNHGLYSRDILSKIGFADEETYFFYQADGDLCLRMAEAGYACIDSPDSVIEHYLHTETETRNSNIARRGEDWKAFTARWESLGKPSSSWIERQFDDPHRTADKYWQPPVLS